MTNPERYLARAAELETMATRAADPAVRAEWQRMAASYQNIAEMVQQPHVVPDEPVVEYDPQNVLTAISTEQKNILLGLARALEGTDTDAEIAPPANENS